MPLEIIIHKTQGSCFNILGVKLSISYKKPGCKGLRDRNQFNFFFYSSIFKNLAQRAGFYWRALKEKKPGVITIFNMIRSNNEM